ncbi:MAG TPA: carbon monoxide dehydrogenase subunit G, partial [Candidatus Sulfotelmatobacter sp.]|nr:carbon monoxide dehydrogenase subunit G [Candidatus Sulfotelmatobacter sp.]
RGARTMDMTGETLIPAPRDAVWRALNDPEVLRQAIPGCETIEKVSDTEFSAKVVAKVGPVRATFTGQVQLSDLDPPNGYRISGEGKGGPAGFAKGGATVKLSDADGGTKLNYTVDAQIGGKLAQIGSRLIDATARSMAQDFFGRFSKLVAAGDSAHDAVAGDTIETPEELMTSPQADEAAAMDAAARQTRSLPPWIWIGGLIVLVIVIVALFAH